MKLLLDAHAILWWLSDDSRLGPRARTLINDLLISYLSNDVLFSVVSLWEIVVKVRARPDKFKLEVGIDGIELKLVMAGFERLAITPIHLARLATLPSPPHHKDPFDHLLIAQAIAENAVFMSEDSCMSDYPIQVLRCSGS